MRQITAAWWCSWGIALCVSFGIGNVQANTCSPAMQPILGHYQGNSVGQISQLVTRSDGVIVSAGLFDGVEMLDGTKHTNQNLIFQRNDFTVPSAWLKASGYQARSLENIAAMVAHPNDASVFYLQTGKNKNYHRVYKVDAQGNQQAVTALNQIADSDYGAGTLHISPDGRYLYLSYQSASNRGHVVKYDLQKEQLDNNFSFGFLLGGASAPKRIKTLQDGSLLVSHYAQRPKLWKVDAATGTKDASFSVDIALGYGVLDMAQQSDGKVVLAGSFGVSGDGKTFNNLMRIHLDGSLDTSFFEHDSVALSSSVVDNYRGTASVEQVFVDSDDELFIRASNTTLWNEREYGKVIKLNTDGSVNAAWQKNTFHNFTQSTGSSDRGQPSAIHLQADGKLLMAYNHTGYSNLAQQALVRVHNNGVLDTLANQNAQDACAPPVEKHTLPAQTGGFCDADSDDYMYAATRESFLFRYDFSDLIAARQAGYQREYIAHNAHDVPVVLGKLVDYVIAPQSGNIYVLYDKYGVVAYSPAGVELWRYRSIPLSNEQIGTHQRWVHELAVDPEEEYVIFVTSRPPKTGWTQYRILRLEAKTGEYSPTWSINSIYSQNPTPHFSPVYSTDGQYMYFMNTQDHMWGSTPVLRRVNALDGEGAVSISLPNIVYGTADRSGFGLAMIDTAHFLVAMVDQQQKLRLYKMRLENTTATLVSSYGSNGIVTLGNAIDYASPQQLTVNAQGEAFIRKGRSLIKVDAQGNVTDPLIETVMFDGVLQFEATNRNYCPNQVLDSCLVDPAANDCDLDQDGVPNSTDTDDDGDGLPDSTEGTGDPDQDGLDNAHDTDSDGDGLLDSKEVELGTDPLKADSDGDGLSDAQEVNQYQTNPLSVDSDGDSLADGVEANTLSSNPLQKDSDGDGLWDNYELGSLSAVLDTDQDQQIDILDADDDGDGVLTKNEVADPNGDGSPADARDLDQDGIPSYLDSAEVEMASVRVKALLQGASYHAETGLMQDGLRANGFLPLAQPYNTQRKRLTYDGAETTTAAILAQTGADAPVDWMLIQLRDAAKAYKVVAVKAVLLQRDGDLANAADNSDVLHFNVPAGDYYVSVAHRNHMGVVTKEKLTLDSSAPLVDFSTKTLLVRGGNRARLTHPDLDYALLRVGDMNHDGRVISLGRGNDIAAMVFKVLNHAKNTNSNMGYVISGYDDSDLNMDGYIIAVGNNNDLNVLLANILLHPDNTTRSSNFIIMGDLPDEDSP